jgi:hypothetical protein
MPREEKHKARRSAQKGVSPVAEQAAVSVWHERAAFHITFDHAAGAAGQTVWQTRAYHEESDDQAIWPDLSSDTLVDWMRDKAGLPAAPQISVPVEPAEASAAGDPTTDLDLHIGALEIEEVLANQEVGGLGTGGRMRAQIEFALGGPAAYLASAHQSRYDIQVLACDLSSGQISILATGRQRLNPETLNYRPSLEFELPSVGSYLTIGIILLGEENTFGSSLGPTLTVIP